MPTYLTNEARRVQERDAAIAKAFQLFNTGPHKEFYAAITDVVSKNLEDLTTLKFLEELFTKINDTLPKTPYGRFPNDFLSALFIGSCIRACLRGPHIDEDTKKHYLSIVNNACIPILEKAVDFWRKDNASPEHVIEEIYQGCKQESYFEKMGSKLQTSYLKYFMEFLPLAFEKRSNHAIASASLGTAYIQAENYDDFISMYLDFSEKLPERDRKDSVRYMQDVVKYLEETGEPHPWLARYHTLEA